MPQSAKLLHQCCRQVAKQIASTKHCSHSASRARCCSDQRGSCLHGRYVGGKLSPFLACTASLHSTECTVIKLDYEHSFSLSVSLVGATPPCGMLKHADEHFVPLFGVVVVETMHSQSDTSETVEFAPKPCAVFAECDCYFHRIVQACEAHSAHSGSNDQCDTCNRG